jgi:dienelactone hydrolase
MSITQKLFVKLPGSTQMNIANSLLNYNILYRLPMFRMFFRTLTAFGAERHEMLKALEASDDLGDSFFEAWNRLGVDLSQEARVLMAADNQHAAKDAWLRSTIYHLVADWPLPRGPRKRRNYEQAMQNFESFKRHHFPRIQKVALPFRRGKVMANFRLPENAGPGNPVPAILIFQGNDSVKEFMVYVEDVALRHGLATLTVDQPGFGESGMTGNYLDSEQAVALCIRSSISYLQHHNSVDHDAIGAFGFSFGGFTSLYSAGLSESIKAVATIGAPVRLRRAFSDIPYLMKQRTFQWSGCQSDAEIDHMLHKMDVPSVIQNIKSPAYVVHGLADDVVSVNEGKLAHKWIGRSSSLKLVKDGDHTCSAQLDELLPELFDWMHGQLH